MALTFGPEDAGAGASITQSFWQQIARFWASDGFVAPAQGGTGTGFAPFGDSSGMQIKTGAGTAFCQGVGAVESAQQTIAIAASNPSNPRIDVVCLRFDFGAHTVGYAVVQGTPSSTPAVPAINTGPTVYDLAIAQVTVPANAATIAAGNVADVRPISHALNPVGAQTFQGVTVQHPTVGANTALQIQDTAGGGTLWALEVGASGLGPNQLLIGRYRTGSTSGIGGGPFEVVLALTDDGATRSLQMTTPSGVPLTTMDNVGGWKVTNQAGSQTLLAVRSDNATADPGSPWFRGDGNTINLNSRNSGTIGLNVDEPTLGVVVGGGLTVDAAGTNAGSIDTRYGGTGSGEGIGSRRTSGTNQNGLDLYTGSSARLSVTNAGNVGVGTQTPAFLLDVAGTARANVLNIGTTPFRVPMTDTGSIAVQAMTSTTFAVTFAAPFTAAPKVYLTPVSTGGSIAGATFQFAAENVTATGFTLRVVCSNTGMTFGFNWEAVGI